MSAGFTLIEIVVVIVIIGVISASLTVAYPNVRDWQKLKLAEQQLQASLREAQQAAINEERSAACLASFSSNPALQKHCSNIGVTVAGGELIMFADTSNLPANEWEHGHDIEIKRIAFPDGVTVEAGSSTATTFVFEATPPTVTLFVGSTPVAAPHTVTLQAGATAATFTVHAYGQVERN